MYRTVDVNTNVDGRVSCLKFKPIYVDCPPLQMNGKFRESILQVRNLFQLLRSHPETVATFDVTIGGINQLIEKFCTQLRVLHSHDGDPGLVAEMVIELAVLDLPPIKSSYGGSFTPPGAELDPINPSEFMCQDDDPFMNYML